MDECGNLYINQICIRVGNNWYRNGTNNGWKGYLDNNLKKSGQIGGRVYDLDSGRKIHQCSTKFGWYKALDVWELVY